MVPRYGDLFKLEPLSWYYGNLQTPVPAYPAMLGDLGPYKMYCLSRHLIPQLKVALDCVFDNA